jgi:4-hydroxythreonine-4-phosphate dehydrogenase
LAKKGIVDGIVTAPISKEALGLAGSPFRGHTELVAKRAGAGPPVMFFAGPGMRVALVTTHIPLKKVPAAITKENILHTIRVTAKALETGFGENNPSLAILSLNPHAGESGLLGREEKDILLPAIRAAGKERIRCEGPFPADTAFLAENRKRFSAFVAMYHDQALLAVKLLLFRKSVNITLGTGIIRTSVDHGTAYSLAGTGKADPASMIQAVKMARRLANRQGGKK